VVLTKQRARRIKDIADRALAGTALVALSPLMAAIAAWIAVSEGRPVIFAQQRTGLDGQTFTMYKFRTMIRDGVRVGLESGLTTDDPFGLVENDPRITPSGRFLRRTSLDELPQLINVVRGEMSLVGPRPDVPEQSVHYTPRERQRLRVKPGITGWSQVNGRDELPWPQRHELDAWYVANWSLALDLRILLATVKELRRSEPSLSLDAHNMERRRTALSEQSP
jgi:lipopolysaccharide/colanic/teichoic acid biosynthesis glycosyltransferase